MIRSISGKTPKIAGSAYISEAAYIIGDVEIGEDSNVWPGAVIRGDCAKITIGKGTSIQDNSVVHADTDLTIGGNVMIGHAVVIHCKKVGNSVLVGNNATILDGAEVGDYCLIGANTMVRQGMKILSYSLVEGVPAQVKKRGEGLLKRRLEHIGKKYVFNGRRYKEAGLE